MTELRQRQEEYRSAAYLAGSRGETCKLRFLGVCNANNETTVPCHAHDGSFAMARKANDLSVIDGCSNCHRFLDGGWVGKISRETLLEHIVRGLQETLLSRVLRDIAKVKRDPVKTFAEKPVRPRLPPEQRAKIQSNPEIQSRPTNWPPHRMVGRNDLRKERART